ncbi:acetylcholinesterase-1-like [Haemaphysalis longicornis]
MGLDNTRTSPDVAALRARILLAYRDTSPTALEPPGASPMISNAESPLSTHGPNAQTASWSFWSMYGKKLADERRLRCLNFRHHKTACLACCVASILAAAVATLALLQLVSTKQERIFVRMPFGLVRGLAVACEGRPVHAFRGLPFARPPLGELRFQKAHELAPEVAPDDAVDRVFDGTLPHAPCLQKDDWTGRHSNESGADPASGLEGREDCLTLSIWKTPGYCGAQLRAVIFLVHGHFFHLSHADDEGRCLAALGGVVVVAPHYRLGVLGFLNAPPDTPGNMALTDLALALNWTEKNAQYFCGDGTNIVPLGHNAGAHAIGYLLHNPDVVDIKRAILINETPFTRYFDNTNNAKANVEVLAERLGYDLRVPLPLSVLNASAAMLVQAAASIGPVFVPSFRHALMPYPSYDRRFLKDPERLRVDVLVGYTDGGVYSLADAVRFTLPRADEVNFTATFLGLLGMKAPGEVILFYQKLAAKRKTVSHEADGGLLSDLLHACPVQFYAKFLSRGFNRVSSFVLPRHLRPTPDEPATTKAPIADARWPERNADLERALGIFLPHDSYLEHDAGGRAKLSRKLIAIWADFAATGYLPEVNGTPWPRVFGRRYVAVNISPGALTLVGEGFKAEQCQFLEPHFLI